MESFIICLHRNVNNSKFIKKKNLKFDQHPRTRSQWAYGYNKDLPYLFAMIMDVLACGIMDLSPWCMLHADDIILCGIRR